MTKIDRDSKIVVEFKQGASVNRLAREFKLKPPTVERIVRNWFNDVASIAIKKEGQSEMYLPNAPPLGSIVGPSGDIWCALHGMIYIGCAPLH